MQLLFLELLVIAGLCWLWAHSSSSPATPPPRTVDRPGVPPPPPAVATIHLVFVQSDERTLLLDCMLAEPYGAVPAGQAFTMVVRLPGAIAPHLAAVFERWSEQGRPVYLRVEVDQHGPRARFVAGDTQARLEILASSPLRGADGRT